MTTTDNGARQAERQFVGTVCASLSHEIKNCLAIITENAGLMPDLALMAGQGRPVDPERQARIAAAVQKQVRRADGLVVHLNRFAHSGDVARGELDLAETLTLVATLFERTASKAGRRVSVTVGEGLMVETAPLGLLQLLWGLLSLGIQVGESDGLPVNAEAETGRAVVRIGAPGHPMPPLPEPLLDLAGALGGVLEVAAQDDIRLSLPLKSRNEA